ncbi:hypothetical protein D3C86_1079890 [compost metagenome]
MFASRSRTCAATLRSELDSSRGVHKIPWTFSISKTLGAMCDTQSRKASTSRLLGFELDQLFRFALEKPWHGGPPINTSTSPCSFAIAPSRALTSLEQRSIGAYSAGVMPDRVSPAFSI